MSSTAYDYISMEDTRRLERETDVRHEWWDGVAIAMAGGTIRHGVIIANLHRRLGNALDGNDCRDYHADIGIRSITTDRLTYPDLSVVCGDPQTHPSDDRALTNPTVIVEVLSPSTEATDRGNKLQHYMSIETVEHVLLVTTQGEERVEHFRRTDLGWLFTSHRAGDTVKLDAIGVSLAVDDVYDRVPAEPPPPVKKDDEASV